MQRSLQTLKNEKFDVVIIGGGITGACLFLECVGRDLRTCLIEKDDFCSKTSSASSKLIHGGVRYLQQGQINKLNESARERAYFLNMAPFLFKNIQFLVPTYRDSILKGRLALYTGMKTYETLCYFHNQNINSQELKINSGQLLSKSDLINKVSFFESQKNVSGAYQYTESHMISSERMVLQFLKTGVSLGGVLANYVSCSQFLCNSEGIKSVQARDQLSGDEFEISCDYILNAAGPFIFQLNQSSLKNSGVINTGFSKGLHLVTDCLEENYALALASRSKSQALVSRGGRHFFIIPWRGKSLIGTANFPFKGDPQELNIFPEEVEEFIKNINAVLGNDSLSLDKVSYAFSGLYPLQASEILENTYQGTGNYQIWDHESDGFRGLISVLGAKYTTARAIAKEACKKLHKKMGKSFIIAPEKTSRLINCVDENTQEFLRALSKKIINKKLIDYELIKHWYEHYGKETHKLIQWSQKEPELLKKVTESRQIRYVEILLAIKEEMAFTLKDICFRRTGLLTIGFIKKNDLIDLTRFVSVYLNWSEKKQLEEIDQVTLLFKCWGKDV